MKVLFLSRWFPHPPNNGSKLRILALLRGLAWQHRVSLLSFADDPNASVEQAQALCGCEQVRIIPWREFRPDSQRARVGYLSRAPRWLVDTFSTDMRQALESMLLSEDFDLVIGSQLNALNYAPYLSGTPAVLEEAELGVFYGQYTDSESHSVQRRLRAGLTWFKLQRYMASQTRYFRAATVASEQERQLLMAAAPNLERIEVIPNCLDMTGYAPAGASPRPYSLIFTGPFRYSANYEAMSWFLRDVYPRIQRMEPDVTLTITGDHANLPLPPATNVTLTGYVNEVLPLVAHAACSIAPLRTGGGTRLKILEAMALGTPVVATSKGAEGLEAEDGVHLLIADTAEAFAGATLRVMRETELRKRLVANGLALVRSQYSWEHVMPRFLDLVEWAAKDGHPVQRFGSVTPARRRGQTMGKMS